MGCCRTAPRCCLADGSKGQAPEVEGFGRVLLETVRGVFALGYGAACLLAADSPTLPTAEIARAAQMLLDGQCDAVLGAVEDGGYYLVGLRTVRASRSCAFDGAPIMRPPTRGRAWRKPGW